MNKLLMTVLAVSYVSTCMRLLCYRRGLSNYRLPMSALAWLLIVATGTSVLEILQGRGVVSFGQAGIAVILCGLVWRAQGNVAQLLGDRS